MKRILFALLAVVALLWGGKKIDKFKKLCAMNNMAGCVAAGWFYEAGIEVGRRNYTWAVALFKRACENGNMEGCLSLGDMYEKGRGVPLNYDYAYALYKYSCEGGFKRACKFLANLETKLGLRN
jgi:TPR repeat protein